VKEKVLFLPFYNYLLIVSIIPNSTYNLTPPTSQHYSSKIRLHHGVILVNKLITALYPAYLKSAIPFQHFLLKLLFQTLFLHQIVQVLLLQIPQKVYLSLLDD